MKAGSGVMENGGGGVLHTPEIAPRRDASVGFGLWPWAKGPLWRLEDDWPFVVVSATGEDPLPFTIPAGYEFDKASIPSVLWGFPFNYTPDGLCTVAALEHDFLCDLLLGGSAWLRARLGVLPEAPAAQVIHRHFYERLRQWGVRRTKARAMWEAVRALGPGGWMRPGTWWAALRAKN